MKDGIIESILDPEVFTSLDLEEAKEKINDLNGKRVEKPEQKHIYPCWVDLIPCEHYKNISDANEEEEFECELNDWDEECPFKMEVEDERD